VTPVTDDEFGELLAAGFGREAVHLETRDAYGTAVELPHMARWARGEHDDLEWLQGWCATLREHARAGRPVRRARPPSADCSALFVSRSRRRRIASQHRLELSRRP
jgi:hypothetical protein